MHRDICLASIGVTQDDVRSGLSSNDETSALQASKNLTRFV
jgi:hypothetical protein